MNPTIKDKRTHHWLSNNKTKIVIESIIQRFNIGTVCYELSKGVQKRFAGTYAHPVLHTQFMIWLNQEYEIEVAMLLHDLHQAQGDIVIEQIGKVDSADCKICQIESVHPAYDGYCRRCYEHVFPEETQQKNFLSKEKSYMAPLKDVYGNSLVLDKIISGGCSRRRPDGFIDVLTHVIIIEIDENQHRAYDETCENKRIMELSQDVAHRPIVFIRLNPDEYKSGKERIDSSFHITKQGVLIKRVAEYERRLQMLKASVEDALEQVPDRLITTIRLCFDE